MADMLVVRVGGGALALLPTGGCALDWTQRAARPNRVPAAPAALLGLVTCRDRTPAGLYDLALLLGLGALPPGEHGGLHVFIRAPGGEEGQLVGLAVEGRVGFRPAPGDPVAALAAGMADTGDLVPARLVGLGEIWARVAGVASRTGGGGGSGG